MRTRVLQEKNYAERMQNGVEPYLAAHAEEFYWERESGHPIHVLRYRAFRPRGVVVISHGFTENAEKYKEIVYYFIKEHFHVYLPEHCGHGKSYRLVEDPSLVYVDSYHRYVEDLLFVARKAKAEASLPCEGAEKWRRLRECFAGRCQELTPQRPPKRRICSGKWS